MTATQSSKSYLYTLPFLFVSIMHVSSFPPFSQKAWLSEYGYVEETVEEMKLVSFPVHQTENCFNNSFLSKTDTEVIVHGNLTYVVFTCEAEYPISWFVNKELKIVPKDLKTRTYDFQSVSNDNGTRFRSLIDIYLDELESDNDEDPPELPSGKWEFRCQKLNAPNEYCGGPSITLNLEHSLITDQNSYLNHLNFDETIIISILKRQPNSSVNDSGYDLNYMRHPSFDDQPIILWKNFTIDINEFDDGSIENIKLIEYDENENMMEGDVIQIICFSTKKLYSYGIHVEIIWENGTEIALPEEMYDVRLKPEVFLSDSSKYLAEQLLSEEEDLAEEDLIYFLSKEIQVDLGMKQITCNMPVWVTGKWDKVSRDIKVVVK